MPLFTLLVHEEPIPFNEILIEWKTLLKENEYFRFWWFPHTEMCMKWRANKTDIPIKAKKGHSPRFAVELYQGLLYFSLMYPRILPYVNKFFSKVLHGKKQEYVDIPPRVMHFDCLFPQYTIEYALPI